MLELWLQKSRSLKRWRSRGSPVKPGLASVVHTGWRSMLRRYKEERSETAAEARRYSGFLQFFHREVGVGIDANFAGYAHGFHGQVFGVELGMFEQGAGSREGIAAARTDSAHAVIRL